MTFMADLLIKDMEMPRRCGECSIWDGYCVILDEGVDTHTRHPSCPLVEVKPHVRCIDADSLRQTIISCIKDAEKEYTSEDLGLVKMVYESCLYHIGQAVTVLEASYVF